MCCCMKLYNLLIVIYYNSTRSASIFIMLDVRKPDLIRFFSFFAIWG